VRADEYHRFNGLLRYSHTSGPTVLAITGMAYNGAFNSTDQIPQRLVDAGVLSRYGYIDPTDGGNTYRYALSGQLTRTDARGATKVNVYGVNSLLSLSSNFTYSLFDANDYYNVTANPVTCNVAYTTCAERRDAEPERRRLTADGSRRWRELRRWWASARRRRIGAAHDEIPIVLPGQ